MTKRDIYTLVFQLSGLYCILSALHQVYGLVQTVGLAISSGIATFWSQIDTEQHISVIATIVAFAAPVCVGFCLWLLAPGLAAFVVARDEREQNFVPAAMSRSDWLHLAMFILGFYTIIQSIPYMALIGYQERSLALRSPDDEILVTLRSELLKYGLGTLMGLLLIFYGRSKWRHHGKGIKR